MSRRRRGGRGPAGTRRHRGGRLTQWRRYGVAARIATVQGFRPTARRLARALLAAWLLSLAGPVLAGCLGHLERAGPAHAPSIADHSHGPDGGDPAGCCEHPAASDAHCQGAGIALAPALVPPAEPAESDRDPTAPSARPDPLTRPPTVALPVARYHPPPGVLRPALFDRTRVLRI